MAVVRCMNWEEVGEKMVFVRSVRDNDSGSGNSKFELPFEAWCQGGPERV